MKLKLFRTAFTCLLCLIVLSQLNVTGQSTSGSITGNITDAAGSAIPGAGVTVVNQANKVSQTAVATDDGSFVVPQLPPGTYTVVVEKGGFKKLEKTDIFLSAADRINAGDFVMEVGGVEMTVTVAAEAGQLQVKTESGERSDLITNKQINNLAMNGRNLLDLMKVVPGVVSNVNGQVSNPSNQLGAFNINGARSRQQELTIDGSSNVTTSSNASQHVTINPDAVAEVKILTSNFQAEYGKAGGGFISFVTKSGGRDFRGTARYFRRHDSLNANNFFRNAEGRTPTGYEVLPRPLYRYDYFGYDLGGPVYIPKLFNENKEKFFFFFSQEYYRQLIPQAARNIRVPTAEERGGDFSQTTDGNRNRVFLRDPTKAGTCTAANTLANPGACFVYNNRLHVIDPARFSRDGRAILNLYPAANISGDPRFNYTSSISNDYPRREDILRLDYNLSGATRLTGRVINNADEQVNTYGGVFFSTINFPLTQVNTSRPAINGAFTLFHAFTPTLTNEFIFGPSKTTLTIEAIDDKFTRAANGITTPLLFSEANPADYLPNYIYGGIQNQTFPNTGFSGIPYKTINSTLNFIDNVTKVFAGHTVKAGVYIQQSRAYAPPFTPINGNINFALNANNPLDSGHPYANALLGNYNSYQQASSAPEGLFKYINAEFYAQDTWKIHPRLTLDYGMRFSYYQPQYDERLQTGVFNPGLFDPARAVRLYEPICVGAAPCSGASLRAYDPASRPAIPSQANTLSSAYIGLIVPNSGDPTNGIGRASEGYPRGGFDRRGLLLGPRFGFAYDVTGDAKTVLRGGFGISYDRIQGNFVIDQLATPPTIQTPQLFFGNLENVGSGLASTAPPSVLGYAKDGNIPTVYSFSLGAQRDLGVGVVLDVAYVGTLSRHLVQSRDLNAIPFGVTFGSAAQDPTRFAGSLVPSVEPNLPLAYRQAGLSFSGVNAKRVEFLRPYRGYQAINFREFVGSSNYHSLQVSASRRFTRALTFGLAYTYSKAMGTAEDDTDGVNPFDTRRYDYRLLDFDRTHVLVANYVYDLPKVSRFLGENFFTKAVFDNWQISGISQFVTGTPTELGLTIQGITAGQRITGSYTVGPRFVLGRDPQPGPDGLVVDPAAIVVPPIGSVGLGSRNYLRNPGFNNHDISVFKNFPFGADGTRYLQLRLEMFNAFNHTQFAGFNGGTQLTTAAGGTGNAVFGTPTQNPYDSLLITNNLRPANSREPLGRFFGEYNSARDPRIIQLGVKLYF